MIKNIINEYNNIWNNINRNKSNYPSNANRIIGLKAIHIMLGWTFIQTWIIQFYRFMFFINYLYWMICFSKPCSNPMSKILILIIANRGSLQSIGNKILVMSLGFSLNLFLVEVNWPTDLLCSKKSKQIL